MLSPHVCYAVTPWSGGPEGGLAVINKNWSINLSQCSWRKRRWLEWKRPPRGAAAAGAATSAAAAGAAASAAAAGAATAASAVASASVVAAAAAGLPLSFWQDS